MSQRACPVLNCPRTVRDGDLMCRAHWYRVSVGTRHEVWATWKTWSAKFGDPEAMRQYKDASEQAVMEASR